jgi:hypothetical protein
VLSFTTRSRTVTHGLSRCSLRHGVVRHLHLWLQKFHHTHNPARLLAGTVGAGMRDPVEGGAPEVALHRGITVALVVKERSRSICLSATITNGVMSLGGI